METKEKEERKGPQTLGRSAEGRPQGRRLTSSSRLADLKCGTPNQRADGSV